MKKKELAQLAETTYSQTAGLVKLVPGDKLDWRPSDTGNWWTMGQLLHHLPEATGGFMKGLIKGQWPEDEEDAPSPGDEYPSISSVAEAIEKLEASRALTKRLLAELPEDDYSTRTVVAPWDRVAFPLPGHLFGAVMHQVTHKTQLFFYLKLLGVNVDTRHLYGMEQAADVRA